MEVREQMFHVNVLLRELLTSFYYIFNLEPYVYLQFIILNVLSCSMYWVNNCISQNTEKKYFL